MTDDVEEKKYLIILSFLYMYETQPTLQNYRRNKHSSLRGFTTKVYFSYSPSSHFSLSVVLRQEDTKEDEDENPKY